MDNLLLLPQPRSLNLTSGQNLLNPGKYILLEAAENSSIVFCGQTLQANLRKYTGYSYALSASATGPTELFGIVLRRVNNPEITSQGYRLIIAPKQIMIEATTPAGIFYGVTTLTQIIKQSGLSLPCLEINDWPAFPVRGYMLDISRDKVPTMQTLYGLIDKLAEWKINQLQLYTEHTFAYLNHPTVWKEASPVTGQEILELDRYCKERFIELVPNQNSFGHMNRWLVHSEYSELAEVTEGYMTPWGYRPGPFSLDPTNPASFDLVHSLFDELLPHFSSRQVNIGCDETFDLGQGKSKELCEQIGKHKVYLDFLLKVSQDLIGRGYTVQFWGDILKEAPEVIPLLPKELIGLIWGYEETYPFELECSHFQAAGIPFYVCPGTSAWTSLAGRTNNALGNLLNAAVTGLKYGAAGYLITDWGDQGHWQTLPVSYLGIAAGAAFSWSVETNRNLDLAEALNSYAFEDRAGVMGQLAYELGQIYLLPGLAIQNGTMFFWHLQFSDERLMLAQNIKASSETTKRVPFVEETTLYKALELIERVLVPLNESRMDTADADLIKREFALTAQMMRLACQRALMAADPSRFRAAYGVEIAEMIEEYKQIWLSRNRPGGLKDSLAGLEKLLA
ncbi:MAG TPA: glycoside hydrolase family 20 zincin-like fold domain-containing protein [Chloroflexia bacterium]|nr:glycoside hydrolase family 20 zincin-like fold domain-containing protein [Chloroflexia bacterium]